MSDPSQNPPAAGFRLRPLDPGALAKAEAALKSLSGNFAEWMANEITKLDAAWATVRAEGVSASTMDPLYLRVHDLKGLGATYGFPIVTNIAGMLCRRIGDSETRLTASLAMIEAHIVAIKTAVRDNVTSDEQPLGRALIESLTARVGA